MARIWKEEADGRRYGDTPREPVPSRARNLVKQEFICVKVCSFTFRFVTKEEIAEYIDFYRKKTHPSSRVPAKMLPDCNFRHWHSQRWYERLPLFLQEEPKREKVLKALREALTMVEAGKL